MTVVYIQDGVVLEFYSPEVKFHGKYIVCDRVASHSFVLPIDCIIEIKER